MSTVIQVQKISKDTFALPDGTIVYTMAKAIKEYKKIKPVKYTLSDLILILLYSQPQVIRGQTKFFRQMFFLDRLVFRRLIKCPFQLLGLQSVIPITFIFLAYTALANNCSNPLAISSLYTSSNISFSPPRSKKT